MNKLSAKSLSIDPKWSPVVRLSRIVVDNYLQQQRTPPKMKTSIADIFDSNDMQPMVVLDRSTIPQALIDRAQATTSREVKSTATISTSGKKKSNAKAKTKPASKKPIKAGRPQFVLNFAATRSKKN